MTETHTHTKDYNTDESKNVIRDTAHEIIMLLGEKDKLTLEDAFASLVRCLDLMMVSSDITEICVNVSNGIEITVERKTNESK